MNVNTVKPSDIVVTTKDCKFKNTIIPKGSYFVVVTVGSPISSTGSVFIHVEGTKKVFSNKEVDIAKTFALNDIVRFEENHPGLGFNNTDTWRVVKIQVVDKKIEYVIEPTRPSGNGNIYFETVSGGDLIGVNVNSDIKLGDTVIILKENDKHHKETMSVTQVHNIGGKLSYKLNGSMFVYGEKDIRLWEAKDEEIRIKIYKLSKTLRENTYKLNDIHYDNEWCEEAKKEIKDYFDYLKSSYEKFINERIFTEETINILNTMYKEAKIKKQIIEHRIKEQKEVEDV